MLDATKTYSLLRIHDVRPIDWDTGKRVAVDVSELPECVRCGRRHAVVWTLLEQPSGDTLTVGCGCGPKLLEEGLLPGVDFPAVKQAEKAMRAEVKRLQQEHALERVEQLAAVAREATKDLVPPDAVWTEDRYSRTEYLTCAIGEVFQCVAAADLAKQKGEWGRVDRADLEQRVKQSWLMGRAELAILAEGCPRNAAWLVREYAFRPGEGTKLNAARAVLP